MDEVSEAIEKATMIYLAEIGSSCGSCGASIAGPPEALAHARWHVFLQAAFEETLCDAKVGTVGTIRQ